jgi:hypothetical protein
VQFDYNGAKNIPVFTKLNPKTTLPAMSNNVSCTKDSSILMTHNSRTLFIYNEPYNLQKRINCIYYSTKLDTLKLECLPLPSLKSPSTTASNGSYPPLNYDKMNFICTNDKILLGLSCSNRLNFILLDETTNAPIKNSTWAGVEFVIPNIPNITNVLKNINYLGINDNAVFMYYNDYTNPATLLYSKINIIYSSVYPLGYILNLKLEQLPIIQASSDDTNKMPSKPNFYSNGFAINNNVIFGLEKADRSGNMNLWWCSLNNGLPSDSSMWQHMNLANQGLSTIPFYNLIAMNIFNNSLIITYNTGSNNNLVIPLLTNLIRIPTTTTNITTTTNADTTTETTIPIATTSSSTISQTIPTTTSENSARTNNSNITNSDSDSDSDIKNNKILINQTTTNPNTTIPNITNSSSTTLPNITNSSSTTLPNITNSSSTTLPNTNNKMKPSVGVDTVLNGIATAAQNGIQTELGIYGVNGNLGNRDNINDFMKDANLLGNNIYVSPMNNDTLYNPQAKLADLGKITSSFFPMIKIAQ